MASIKRSHGAVSAALLMSKASAKCGNDIGIAYEQAWRSALTLA